MCEIKSPDDFDSILEVATYFKDDKICLDYIEAWMLGGCPQCPVCQSVELYRLKEYRRRKCVKCKKQFSILVGTIFESSQIPLPKWMMAMYLTINNKKGINSCALAKQIKVTQKSSWFMLHRIRKGLDQSDVKLSGIIQSDEAFVGGKNRNRHKAKRVKYTKGRNFKDKVPVLGMMEQGGRVKPVVLSSVSGKAIRMGVLTSVEPNSILVSDEYHAYKKILGRYYEHHTVNHQRGSYVNDQGFTTNSIEGFWNHFKNMIRGVYIKLGRKHLQKYCDELAFRWNTMKMSEGQRLHLLITKLHCRLTYKQLING